MVMCSIPMETLSILVFLTSKSTVRHLVTSVGIELALNGHLPFVAIFIDKLCGHSKEILL